MWRAIVIYLGVSLGILMSQSVGAVDRTLRPSVTIFKGEPGEAIEIVADKTDFVAIYQTDQKTFVPLLIPFKVRSVLGVNIDYRLSLSLSQHFCQENSEPDGPYQAWDGVTLWMNDTLFTTSTPVEVNDVVTQSHVLTVKYPERLQTDVDQLCYGTIGLVAGVVDL